MLINWRQSCVCTFVLARFRSRLVDQTSILECVTNIAFIDFRDAAIIR